MSTKIIENIDLFEPIGSASNFKIFHLNAMETFRGVYKNGKHNFFGFFRL